MTTPTPENTGVVTATGAWQPVAGEGDVTVTCPIKFEWAIGTDTPDDAVFGHKEFTVNLLLTGSQKLYMRASAGMQLAVSAVQPLTA